MTSDQLAEAQKMAREMVEANPKLMGESRSHLPDCARLKFHFRYVR